MCNLLLTVSFLQLSSGIIRLTAAKQLYGTGDTPAPCGSARIKACMMQSLLQQRTKQHICVGPIFSLSTLYYVRAANLVLHKLYCLVPHPRFLSFLHEEISSLQMCVLCLPFFALFDQLSGWIASLYYFPPPFLFEPRPRFMLYNFSTLLSRLN